jgi:hypothetical protein
MGILIRLLIAALVLNAGVQSARSLWRFYEFRDGVRAEAMFAGNRTAEQIQARIIDRAAELAVPVDPYDIVVHFEGTATLINVVYVDEVELVPRLYTYAHIYDASADSRAQRTLTGRQVPQ